MNMKIWYLPYFEGVNHTQMLMHVWSILWTLIYSPYLYNTTPSLRTNFYRNCKKCK